MKIADVKPLIVRGPVRNLMVVKVETDDGYHGWGESGVVGRELAVKGAVEHYREFLIGRDPRRIGALWQEMYRSQYFEGGRVLTGAISAIDIALHDVVARSLGVPVYQLLGGAQRDWVPCFTTSHANAGPEMVEDAKRLADDGWPAIRFVFATPANDDGDPALFEPRESIALTAEWIVKVREAVGRTPVIGVEYHHRLSVAEAGVLLPDDAVGHPRLPGGADPRRDARRVPGAAPDDRRALRHRRGVFEQVAVSCRTSSRASRTTPG